MDTIDKARDAAAHYLDDRGYDAEARAIRDGQGDDFAEVRIALHLIAQRDERVARYEQALATYADADFWDGPPDQDRGRLARHALAGEALPVQYCD